MSRAPRSESAGFRVRAWFALGAMLLAAGGLVARAVELQLLDKDFYISQGESRFLRSVEIPAARGSIFDRNGEPLAISTPVESVVLNPRELAGIQEEWPKLADALNIKRSKLAKDIAGAQDKQYLRLVRRLTPDESRPVKQLGLPGVRVEREFQRYYPAGKVAGQVLGYTNADDEAQQGLEVVYDHWLAGEAGRKRVIQDLKGRRVQDVESIRSMRPGRDLVLSLDMRIQNLAHQALEAAVEENRAQAGSMVVIDVSTGEVLAMVNLPTFNPNDRAQIALGNKTGAVRNRAATDMMEPGSSIKPFIVAAALESGRYDASSVIDTSPIMVDGKYLEDEHPLGTVGLVKVLAKSSNVGMAKIALSLDKEQIWTMLTQFGFGRLTASGYPGESVGTLSSNYQKWRPHLVSSLSRGYALSVTPLQLAQAYATLGSLGVAHPVSMLRVDGEVTGQRVMSERNARGLLSILEEVVLDGTGTKAAIPGYRVAGKTGTAQKAVDGSYFDDRHRAIFAGVAPASRPRLAAVVVIDDPAGDKYYGGDIAAPAFASVVGRSLRLLGVAPDATSGTSGDPTTGIATMVQR